MKPRPLTSQNTPRKWPVLPVLLGLDIFVLGGLTALLCVNHLLQETGNMYAPYNMDAASTVMDLMDDLLAYLFLCSGLLLFLVLITIAVGVWQNARSRTVRYCITALVLAVLLLSAAGMAVWMFKTTEPPPLPPMTPTPTPVEGAFWRSQAPDCRARLAGLPSTVVRTHHSPS